jgi:FtsP/CotA-like multicopper oxidase with cupredoxin domain
LTSAVKYHCHILDHAEAGMMGMVQLQQ